MSYWKMLGKPSLPINQWPRFRTLGVLFRMLLETGQIPCGSPKRCWLIRRGRVQLSFCWCRPKIYGRFCWECPKWQIFFAPQKKNRDVNHLLWFQKPQKTIQIHKWSWSYLICICIYIYIMYRKRCFFKAFILDTPSRLLWTRTLRVRDDLMWAVLAKQSTCPASFHRRSHFHDRDGTSRWVSWPSSMVGYLVKTHLA